MIPFFGKKQRYSIGRMNVVHVRQCAILHASAFASAWSEAEFESMLLDPKTIADCATDGKGGAVVGFMISRIIGDEGEILMLAVSERWRRVGVGRALLRQQIEAAAAAGVRSLFLEVAENNSPAVVLYSKFGFRQIGRRNAYYAASDGMRLAALTMKLELP